MQGSPWCDVAHLAHAELLTPRLEESLRFFTEVMGLYVSARRGDSVYLRGWDDYEHHTLKLTAAPQPGLGHLAFRAQSPEALARRVAALEASGWGLGWHEGEPGHGPAYRFTDPDGHLIELYYETEWFRPDEHSRPALKNQASRFPAKGANLRRLDHLNLLVSDVATNRRFYQEYLGLRGRRVHAQCLAGTQQGRLRELSWDGLILELPDGTLRHLPPESGIDAVYRYLPVV